MKPLSRSADRKLCDTVESKQDDLGKERGDLLWRQWVDKYCLSPHKGREKSVAIACLLMNAHISISKSSFSLCGICFLVYPIGLTETLRHNYQEFVQYLKPLNESSGWERCCFSILLISNSEKFFMRIPCILGIIVRSRRIWNFRSQGEQGSIYFWPGLKHDGNATVVSCYSLGCRLEHSTLVWVIFIP